MAETAEQRETPRLSNTSRLLADATVAANWTRLKVNDEEDGKTRTFRQQVAKRLKDGANKPEFFASTEY